MNSIKVIAKVKNSRILLDTDLIGADHGQKSKIFEVEKSAGNLLFIFFLILFFGPIVILVFNGELSLAKLVTPTSIIEFLPYIGFYPLILSFFLKRDRNKFDYSVKHLDFSKKVKKIGEENSIDLLLNDYIDFDLSVILDSSVNSKNHSFIYTLTKNLLEDHIVEDYMVNRLGVNKEKFLELLNGHSNNPNFTFNYSYKYLFLYLFDEAVKIQTNSINKEILFFTLNKYFLRDLYRDLGISELELEGLRIWYKNHSKRTEYYQKWKVLSKLKPTSNVNRAYTSRSTPTLDKYSTDFTKEAVDGLFMTTVGKDEELNKLIDVLQRDRPTSCFLLGDPGVGKTRFIRHLATRMVVEDVPSRLYDKRLLVIDLNKVLTQVGNIDEFKKVTQRIFEEVKIASNVVLVLEEFAQILNIRDDSRLEVINLISNAINTLGIKIIATSNTSNYVKYIKPLKALSSLFETITLVEPPTNIALQILIDEVPRVEKKYNVNVRVNSLKRIVEFAPKFDQDRVMPDKGIDLFEEACLIAKNRGLSFLDVAVVDEILSEKVGVKVGNLSESESMVLMNMGEKMHARVIGQDEAIDSIAFAIKRSRSGLTNSKKPIASFLFYGPTGVGKTEVAKTLADVYYGNENLMIRLDMSEYQEDQNLNRIIGYMDEKGNFNGGYLAESVRSRPFSLILLDEIEKANKKVLDLFLQVLDEGSLTDGIGRKIDFSNTVIIMTTNVGSDLIGQETLQGKKYHEIEKDVAGKLRQYFRIEFLNRFDKLIMFRALTRIELEQIVVLMLKSVNESLMQKGISMLWNNDTVSQLADLGYSELYGARELKRIIQENIENKLADFIIQGRLKSGSEAIFNGLTIQQVVN